MHKIVLGGALIAAIASPVAAKWQPGVETKITFASNGGLRDWEPGPPNSGIVYVRDRAEHWYQVTLSGPCVRDRALDRLTYTTDNTGTFDRFSRVKVGRFPDQVCGVEGIKTSLPPPSRRSLKRR